ncbi:MAG: nitroreductase family protein [Nitrospiria bacterium]
METSTSLYPDMNVLDAIYKRRAIRRYSSKSIEEQIVRALLNAAVQAPSAMNLQPWSFTVIQQVKLLQKLSDQAKEFLLKDPKWKAASEHGQLPLADPEFDIFYGATTLIIICAKLEGFSPTADCYLAGQNLMLAACSMGLGTCPIGFARDVLQNKSWKKNLKIPEDFIPVFPIIVGYPLGATQKVKRDPPHILSWIR